MKSLRESIANLAGTEKLASPALQAAYNKGISEARAAIIELISEAEEPPAQPAEKDPFPQALLSAVGATTIGVIAGFVIVNVLKLHIGWIFGFSAVGALVGVSIAALLLREM